MNIYVYLAIGVAVSLFMTWYYMGRHKAPNTGNIYLGVIGPFVWPLQLVKFLWDHFNPFHPLIGNTEKPARSGMHQVKPGGPDETDKDGK